jgi:hypothetical protein
VSHAANSIPGVSRIPDRMIRAAPPPAPPPRGTITLRTKDGHIVKRYLDNMAEDVKPDPSLLEFYCHTPSEDEERQTLLCLVEKMQGTDLVEKYRSHHRKTWEEDGSQGYTTMPVLPQFIGKKLDNSLVAYLHTLRPSSVRISEGTVTCDSSPWRVTVFTKKVDGVEIITSISQEVCIGFGSGYAVGVAYKHIHEGGKQPEPFPRVIGDLSALAKIKFE